MLTDQEVINIALKDMLAKEDLTAQKYAEAADKVLEPNLQSVLKGMEMAARNHSKSISQKISEMSLV